MCINDPYQVSILGIRPFVTSYALVNGFVLAQSKLVSDYFDISAVYVEGLLACEWEYLALV